MRRGALSAALGVALVLVVILARQLGAWRARYDDLNRRFQAPHIQSLRSWRELAPAAEALNGVAVFAASLDSLRLTKSYVELHRLSVPVLLFPESKLAFIYRTQRVPVTRVLDSAGRVLYSRVGLFEGLSARDSVLSFLSGQAGHRLGAARQ